LAATGAAKFEIRSNSKLDVRSEDMGFGIGQSMGHSVKFKVQSLKFKVSSLKMRLRLVKKL